jgi:hypothetical protein
MELYIHSSNTPSWRGAQLTKKHSDNFTLPLPYGVTGIIIIIIIIMKLLSSWAT